MFKCPRCGNKLINFKCKKCFYEIPTHNGVKYFCEEENINTKDDGHKYIGYDDINIHFSPSLIYWGLDHYGIYGASAEDIVKRYGEGIVVLDLGCGLGQATIPFAKAGAMVIGADISEKMLEFTYQRSERKYDNLHICKMNAYNLNLEDESVDVVVENAMIHLVDNPEQVYKEIYRVLKKDGKFIRFTSQGLPITEEQKQLSINSRNAFKDVRNYYYEALKELGYEPVDFDNNSFEIEKKYFYIPQEKENHIILDYEEEFTEFMKFRIHRIEHKAHSFLQHIPDEIHQAAWKKADEYAKEKYEVNYKELKSYSHYKAGYDIYLKRKKYNMELTIRDYIKRELKERDQKVALAYVDFLEENNLEIRKDNGDFWKDSIYYWIVYNDKCVAFIAIKDPSEPDTDWTVYSDDINDKYLLEEYVTEQEKKIAFEHIDSCRCGGGPKKMFGEDVEWCCGTNFRFNVPTMKDLPFMKKMVLLKMMEIDDK